MWGEASWAAATHLLHRTHRPHQKGKLLPTGPSAESGDVGWARGRISKQTWGGQVRRFPRFCTGLISQKPAKKSAESFAIITPEALKGPFRVVAMGQFEKGTAQTKLPTRPPWASGAKTRRGTVQNTHRRAPPLWMCRRCWIRCRLPPQACNSACGANA